MTAGPSTICRLTFRTHKNKPTLSHHRPLQEIPQAIFQLITPPRINQSMFVVMVHNCNHCVGPFDVYMFALVLLRRLILTETSREEIQDTI